MPAGERVVAQQPGEGFLVLAERASDGLLKNAAARATA